MKKFAMFVVLAILIIVTSLFCDSIVYTQSPPQMTARSLNSTYEIQATLTKEFIIPTIHYVTPDKTMTSSIIVVTSRPIIEVTPGIR